jgi:cytidylate kinase
MNRSRPVVAIDGPAGAGKTTVAREVAKTLGYSLVDTGALYRAVALAARERGVRFDDRVAVEALAEALVRDGALALEVAAGEVPKIRLEGRELGDDIRTPELSMGASTVSAHPGVRTALLAVQRSFGADGGVVLEGRDIGTVVFPDAEVKVFLTATAAQRAERRYRELQARGGHETTYEATLADVVARDEQDSARAVAPLRAAPDALVLDSSTMSAEAVVRAIVDVVRGRA